MKNLHQQPKNSIKRTAKTLGPVAELEAHVHPEWWRYIFNAMYIKTDGDVVEDNEITRCETERFISILNLEKESSLLDVCCGQGRHCFEFFHSGFTHVEGIDRSSYLIAKARNKAKLNGYSIKFKEGDARKLPYPQGSFDAVTILGNSFGYFESAADDETVLRSVNKVLKPGGKLLIDVADGNFLKKHFNPRSWEWINNRYFVCRERCLSESGGKLISREVITHTNKGVVADQFYAENLYDEKALEMLAIKAGFKQINFHGAIETSSQRNQDLGMMENRIIMTSLKINS